MVEWKLEVIELWFMDIAYGDTAKMVESLKETLRKYQTAVCEMNINNEEVFRRIEILKTLIKKNDVIN